MVIFRAVVLLVCAGYCNSSDFQGRRGDIRHLWMGGSLRLVGWVVHARVWCFFVAVSWNF